MTDPILAELRILRMARGLRQEDVAKAAGVDPASVNYWENGRKSPHLDKLRRLLAVYGVDLVLVEVEQCTGE